MHLYGDSTGSKTANNYDVELVAAPGDSVENYCKGHGVVSGEYTYTHVWQPALMDVTQYQRATSTGVVRHCCRDHLYDSPTFDENGVERHGTLVFPPYYYHSAAAAARQARSSEGVESRCAVLPVSDVMSDEARRQQQQAGGQGSDERGSGSHETAQTSATVHGAGEWYQPCRTTRYEPVICRTSSSDPDVTLRPHTENHYT